MKTLLRAEEHNWGLHATSDWQRTKYQLSYSGELHVIVEYDHPISDYSIRIAEKDLIRIKSLLKDIKVELEVDACDGTAWKFTSYDEKGKTAFKRDLGYIYGIKALEAIAKILSSYETHILAPDCMTVKDNS